MVKAPIQALLVTPMDRVSAIWTLFFTAVADRVSGKTPVALQSVTVATVPPAVGYTGSIIFVSNETGGATVAFSDGTNWRRVQDRAIIS